MGIGMGWGWREALCQPGRGFGWDGDRRGSVPARGDMASLAG